MGYNAIERQRRALWELYLKRLCWFVLVCRGRLTSLRRIRRVPQKAQVCRFLIIVGYVAGITAKIVNGQLNYVFAVYIVNLVIVLFNLVVYVRNYMIDKNHTVKEKAYGHR